MLEKLRNRIVRPGALIWLLAILGLSMSTLVPMARLLAQATPPASGSSDDITRASISYGAVVTDTITDRSPFDWWTFRGNTGEVIRIRMVGADGLAPLIGVITLSGDLIARSDARPDETLQDAGVDSLTELQFTVPENGEFTIVATRVGNFEGTTTGSYTLSVTLETVLTAPDLQDVTFRCDAYEVTTAATLEIGGEGDDGEYRLSVYGLDGFQPYLRIETPVNGGTTRCSSDGDATIGDQFTLPGENPVTVVEGSPYTLRHILAGMQEVGQLTLTLGSRDGQPGRYLLVIEGYTIDPAGDMDQIKVRLGPLATASTMQVYMLGKGDGRIDPQVRMLMYDEASNPILDVTCDDAGLRTCAEVLPASEYSVALKLDGTQLTGDRLDAGVQFAPGSTERVYIQFLSRTETTRGWLYCADRRGTAAAPGCRCSDSGELTWQVHFSRINLCVRSGHLWVYCKVLSNSCGFSGGLCLELVNCGRRDRYSESRRHDVYGLGTQVDDLRERAEGLGLDGPD